MDLLKELKKLSEQVEVVEIERESTSVEFENNKLKSSKVEQTKGVAVRVVRNGRLGFAASSDMDAMQQLSANALESAEYGDEVPIVFPEHLPAPDVKTYDQKIVDLPVSDMVRMGHEILALLLSAEPAVQVNVQLNRGVEVGTIRNSRGLDVKVTRSPMSISADVTRIEGDDVLIVFDMVGFTTWQDDPTSFATKLVDKLLKARTITQTKSTRMPVLFSPTGSLVWALPLMYGLDGKNVYTGISPMKEKIGEKLFDARISVVDDPCLNGRYNSAAYDDEGVAHRRNILVDQGQVNTFYYDLKTAALSGVEPTGNGARGLFSPPSPSPTNLVVESGDTPVADMIAGIENGILIEDVLGLGQGNIISGAFSNPVSLGFKIENGEITGRVKDISIADNIYDLLKDVSAVSQEQMWVYNQFKAPYILVPAMNVVAKKQ